MGMATSFFCSDPNRPLETRLDRSSPMTPARDARIGHVNRNVRPKTLAERKDTTVTERQGRDGRRIDEAICGVWSRLPTQKRPHGMPCEKGRGDASFPSEQLLTTCTDGPDYPSA